MTAVGQVKTLVAQRKVRNLLIAHDIGQTRPIMKGGINYFVAGESALRIGDGNVTDFTTPSFIEGDGDMAGRERADRDSRCTLGNTAELVTKKFDGLLDLEPSHKRTGEDVAAIT